MQTLYNRFYKLVVEKVFSSDANDCLPLISEPIDDPMFLTACSPSAECIHITLQSTAVCADAPVATSAFPQKAAVSTTVMPYTPAQQKADEATAAQGTSSSSSAKPWIIGAVVVAVVSVLTALSSVEIVIDDDAVEDEEHDE
eukprot:7837-Heterococcus_DN1.PRE.2